MTRLIPNLDFLTGDFEFGPEVARGGNAIIYNVLRCSPDLGDPTSLIARRPMFFDPTWGALWDVPRFNQGVRHMAALMEAKELTIYRTLPAHPHILHPVAVVYSEFRDSEGNGGRIPMHTLFPRCICNLEQYMRNNRTGLSFELSVRAFLCDVLDGLAHLRRHNVLHRDLKAENVLLRNVIGITRPVATICDLGEARDFARMQGAPTAGIGSPIIMAPEATGTVYGLERDMWSFGCMCLDILSAIHGGPNVLGALYALFQRQGTMNITPEHIASFLDTLPYLSNDDYSLLGRSFIQECLSIDPRVRPQPDAWSQRRDFVINALRGGDDACALVCDSILLMSCNAATPDSVQWLCSSICNMIDGTVYDDQRRDVFATASVRDAIVRIAPHATTPGSVQWLCGSICHMTKGTVNVDQRRDVFAIASVRDAIVRIAPHATTPDSVSVVRRVQDGVGRGTNPLETNL